MTIQAADFVDASRLPDPVGGTRGLPFFGQVQLPVTLLRQADTNITAAKCWPWRSSRKLNGIGPSGQAFRPVLARAVRTSALLRVAEREGIQTIFTVDKKDLAVYRLHGRSRITVIP